MLAWSLTLALLGGPVGPEDSAEALHFRVGRAVATDFLASLANDRLTVIHSNVSKAIFISINSDAPVEYVAGETFLWGQVAEQLANDSDSPIRLRILRWQRDSKDCSGIEAALDRMTSALRSTISSNAAITSAYGVSRESTGEMILDATTLLVVTPATNATLTVMPDGSLDPPLQQAAMALYSLVANCASDGTPVVEEHDF